MSDDLVDRLLAVQKFLQGMDGVDGLWISDAHPTKPGKYWWRSAHLPVMAEAAAEITRLRAKVEAADRLAMAITVETDKAGMDHAIVAALTAYKETEE